jgi:hypothetical protein
MLDLMLQLMLVSIQVQRHTLMLQKVLVQYPKEQLFDLYKEKNK